MKTKYLLSALTTVLVASVALPAAAQQKLIPAQSELSFVAKQMGVAVSGQFKRFDAQMSVDPAKLATSKVSFTVDMGSATMGNVEADSALPTQPWFNAPKFPQATFTSTTFKALGAGKYELAGQLSIKGQSREVVVPMTMAQTGAVTVATGVLPIKRLAFKIGEGDWADTSMVADDVQVKFKLAISGVGKL
jgi:polyisoprenoid-binding protein YceI